MTQWTTKAHNLRTAQATLIAELSRTVVPPTPMRPTHPQTAGGDNQQLRGIPAIGKGVTGAIPGTTPGTTP